MEKTIHNVVIDTSGDPTPFNVGTIVQGSKNADIIRIQFEEHNNAELVGVLKATRGDGEKAPAGLLLVSNEIEGTYYYDFEIGQQEVDEEGIGSWFTHVAENIKFSVALIDDEQIVVQSAFEMQVEESSGFDDTATYTFDIIEGFLTALSLRATYDYVDNINDTLNGLITTNQLNITDLDNNKIDKNIIVNLATETEAEKEDYIIIQNDDESEVKKITLEDIKDLVTKVRTVNDVEPDSEDNITIVASDIGRGTSDVDADLTAVELKNTEQDGLLDDAVYIDEGQLEEPFPTTYANALKLNNKEESELDVNSAGNVRDTINNVPISTIFESDGETVKKATTADNILNAENVSDSIDDIPLTNIFETDKTTVKNATNADLAANSTKVYDKTESELKEAMQDGLDGLMERTLLLENITATSSLVTDYFSLSGIELQDGDMLEVVIDNSQLAGQDKSTIFATFDGTDSVQCLTPLYWTYGTVDIGGTTVGYQNMDFRNIRFEIPTSAPLDRLGIYGTGVLNIGKLLVSPSGSGDFVTNTDLNIEKVYLWRKKELI